MLVQPAQLHGVGVGDRLDHVAVAVGPPHPPGIPAGQVHVQVGLEGLVRKRQFFAGSVDAPAMQLGCLTQRAGLEHRFELADVDDDLVSVPKSVDAVEDVGRRHLHPADVGVGPAEGHHPDSGAVLRFPPEGQAGPFGRQRQIEHDRKLPEHDVAIGDGEVVDHRRSAHLDLRRVDQLTLGIGDVIGEKGLEEPVPEEVQLARLRVNLRVCGHVGVELAGEVVNANRRQVPGRQLVGKSDLTRGEQPTIVSEGRHVAVADVGARYPGVGDPPAALEQGGVHPAVGIGPGLSILKMHAVHHSVADEPVPRCTCPAIGTVAHVQPGQRLRDRAGDLERGRRHLLDDGSKVALQPPRRIAGDFDERTRGRRCGSGRRCAGTHLGAASAAGGQQARECSEANGAAPGSGEKLPSVHGPLLHSETITTLPGKRLELASFLRIVDASPNHCHTPEPPVAFTHG